MSREITDHVINPVNDRIKIAVTDEPGAGGANHRYEMTGFFGQNASGDVANLVILFQNGTIPEVGVNGVTQEALLAVVMDQLRSFQKGPFSCRENAIALTKIEEALHWLQQRTIARMRRGVEGKHQA